MGLRKPPVVNTDVITAHSGYLLFPQGVTSIAGLDVVKAGAQPRYVRLISRAID